MLQTLKSTKAGAAFGRIHWNPIPPHSQLGGEQATEEFRLTDVYRSIKGAHFRMRHVIEWIQIVDIRNRYDAVRRATWVGDSIAAQRRRCCFPRSLVTTRFPREGDRLSAMPTWMVTPFAAAGVHARSSRHAKALRPPGVCNLSPTVHGWYDHTRIVFEWLHLLPCRNVKWSQQSSGFCNVMRLASAHR
jgi:hypothetical protein